MNFKTLEDVLNKLRTYDGTAGLNLITAIDRDNFRNRGGKEIEDNIMSEMDFLLKYTVLERTRSLKKEEEGQIFPRINRRYKEEFEAMRAFVYRFEVDKPLPVSFFHFKYIKLVYLWQYSSEDVSVRVEIEVEEREEEEDDFLGIEGGICKRYDVSKIKDEYFERIRAKFTKIEIIRRYRYWLNNVPLSGKVSEMDYNTPYDFVNVFTNQFGLYWETMLKFKRENPSRKVFIRNDGLGAMSMICSALKIDYRSVEPYGIGMIASKLGIITSRDMTLESDADEVEILANLSSYIILDQYVKKDYIVIDENRLFEGVVVDDIKYTSKMKVTSNVLSDTFLNAGKDISKARPLIEQRKNIPIDSKAESYLLMCKIPVYTDGQIRTITKSIVVDKDDKQKCYVMSTEGKVKYITDVTDYYLNIVNRNVPLNWRKGKFGEVKRYRDSTFVFSGEKATVYGDNYYTNLDLVRYKNPYELKKWHRDGYFIMGYSENPRLKNFYVEQTGVKRYIIFLHSIFDKKGKRFDIYQHKEDVNVINSVVVDII